MIHTVFTENKWEIVASDTTITGFYYSRHGCKNLNGSKIWLSSFKKRCRVCDITVPDNIQTLLALLNPSWGS